MQKRGSCRFLRADSRSKMHNFDAKMRRFSNFEHAGGDSRTVPVHNGLKLSLC